MKPLAYHEGQRLIQEEANTTRIANRLMHWVGPAEDFTLLADLFLIACRSPEGTLQFTVLSGAAPLVQPSGKPDMSLLLPGEIASFIPPESRVGGLAINLSQARRARFNGIIIPHPNGLELLGDEVFTLCRKYMAPSSPMEHHRLIGPASREEIHIDNAWIPALLARADTAFLASRSPEGHPDVAHRGGQPGFIKFNPQLHQLSWTEWLGDGIFKSAGNIRATGDFSLLVPDFESGYGLEFCGSAEYTNIRTSRTQRLSPLVQDQEPYPVQGAMVCAVEQVFRLRSLMHPRRRLGGGPRITSLSPAIEQEPQ